MKLLSRQHHGRSKSTSPEKVEKTLHDVPKQSSTGAGATTTTGNTAAATDNDDDGNKNNLATTITASSSSPQKGRDSKTLGTKNLTKLLLESCVTTTTSPRRVLDLDMVTEGSEGNDENDRPDCLATISTSSFTSDNNNSSSSSGAKNSNSYRTGTATTTTTTTTRRSSSTTPTSERILFPGGGREGDTDNQVDTTSLTMSQQMMSPPSQEGGQMIHPSLDVYGNFMMTTKHWSRSNRKSSLPTLSEASMEDGSEVGGDQHDQSFDSWDDGDVPFPPAESSFMFSGMGSTNSTATTTTTTTKGGNDNNHSSGGGSAALPDATRKGRKSSVPGGRTATKRTAAEKVRDLQREAADRACRGLEEEAVRLYRRALHVGRRDVTRVKEQLRQVAAATHHTPVAAKSIASRLHEDWMEIGVLIADTRNAQATIYERLGVYDKAMTCCGEALAVYKRQAKFLKRQIPPEGTAATTAGAAAAAATEYDAVRKQIHSMVEITNRIDRARDSYERRKRAHEEIIALRLEVPSKAPAERRKLYAALTAKVRKVRTSETEILGPQHPQLGDTASLLGSLALEQGDKEAAISYMMEAYSIMKTSLGMKHPRTGMKLLHIASVYNNAAWRRQKMEERLAIDFYKQAIQVFRTSENCPFLLGSTMNDLAVVQIGRKQFDAAVDLLQQALQAYEQGQEAYPMASSWDTAQVWLNLGECHTQKRDYEKASTAFLNALNVQRDGRKIYEHAMKQDGTTASGELVPPSHLVDDRRIADTLRRLGKSYVGCAAYDKAMVFFKEACMIHKNEVKKAVQMLKGRDGNLLPSMQDELAQTIYCMAELNDLTGKMDAAARLYGEALQLRLFADAHKPARTNMVHCAMCLNGLGNLHMKKSEFDQAQGVFKEALGYCSAHGVPSEHPIVQMINQRLKQAVEALEDLSTDEATKLEKRALALFEEGKHDAAVLTLTSVMQARKETLKRLRNDGQDSVQAKHTTACTLKIFGRVLAAKGDNTSAERAYKDSLKLFKKAGTSNTDPVVVQVYEELSRVKGRTTPM